MSAISCLFLCCNFNPLSPGPKPTTLVDTRYKPFLNVFGILRPDSLERMPLSFVHLEHAYPASGIPDSNIITNAVVLVIHQGHLAVPDTVVFSYGPFPVYPKYEYRNSFFSPDSGRYDLVCQREGYPTLTAETIIPGIPVIREGSFIQDARSVSFDIIRDEQAGLYEVMIACGYEMIQGRFMRPDEGDVKISLGKGAGWAGVCMMKIYAYDLNLSEYLTANLSIKPDIYQSDFSMVTNGYGCFGSMNILTQTIEVE
jgi:hypothetical protein